MTERYIDEEEFKSMEKKREDALEVEKEEDEKGDESKKTEEVILRWEHGVARHHRGLQLGDD